MQHDYSTQTQRIFAAIFGLFALVGPVIGVTFSDTFGVRARIVENEQMMTHRTEHSFENHEKFFCSGWAGNCTEKKFLEHVHKLIN